MVSSSLLCAQVVMLLSFSPVLFHKGLCPVRASQITLTTQASAVNLIRCLLVLVDVAAMKQRMMHWVKEVVSLAYDL